MTQTRNWNTTCACYRVARYLTGHISWLYSLTPLQMINTSISLTSLTDQEVKWMVWPSIESFFA
jgi:hypothetical protein